LCVFESHKPFNSPQLYDAAANTQALVTGAARPSSQWKVPRFVGGLVVQRAHSLKKTTPRLRTVRRRGSTHIGLEWSLGAGMGSTYFWAVCLRKVRNTGVAQHQPATVDQRPILQVKLFIATEVCTLYHTCSQGTEDLSVLQSRRPPGEDALSHRHERPRCAPVTTSDMPCLPPPAGADASLERAVLPTEILADLLEPTDSPTPTTDSLFGYPAHVGECNSAVGPSDDVLEWSHFPQAQLAADPDERTELSADGAVRDVSSNLPEMSRPPHANASADVEVGDGMESVEAAETIQAEGSAPDMTDVTPSPLLAAGFTPEEGGRRVHCFNPLTGKVICGMAAPLRKNLAKYLAKNPHMVVIGKLEAATAPTPVPASGSAVKVSPVAACTATTAVSTVGGTAPSVECFAETDASCWESLPQWQETMELFYCCGCLGWKTDRRHSGNACPGPE
jgi:hypothetical protein